MRLVPYLLILLLAFSAPSAMAQTQEMSPAPAPQTPEQAAEPLTSEAKEQAEKLRTELKELLRSRGIGEAESPTMQKSDGISDGQVYGIATGIITGAVVATVIGSGGLGTIVLAAGGGALGNWFMAD